MTDKVKITWRSRKERIKIALIPSVNFPSLIQQKLRLFSSIGFLKKSFETSEWLKRSSWRFQTCSWLAFVCWLLAFLVIVCRFAFHLDYPSFFFEYEVIPDSNPNRKSSSGLPLKKQSVLASDSAYQQNAQHKRTVSTCTWIPLVFFNVSFSVWDRSNIMPGPASFPHDNCDY